MKKLFLLLAIENFSIIPLNAEYFIIKKVKNKKISNIQLFIKYFFYCIAGSILAYFIGNVFKSQAINIIDKFSEIIFNDKEMIKTIILKNNPTNFLIWKSIIPGVPVSTINIICGAFEVDFTRFISATIIYRIIRFILMLIAERLMTKFKFISEILFGFIVVMFSYICIVTMYKMLP